MIELTAEQREGLVGEETIITDPQTNEEFVLVPKGTYQKLKGLLDDDTQFMYQSLANLDPEDWEDSAV